MGILKSWFYSKPADMPKKCAVCQKDIDSKKYWKLKDGYMCENCQRPFSKKNYNAPKSFVTYTAKEVVELLDTLGLSNKSKDTKYQGSNIKHHATLTEANLKDIFKFKDKPFSLTGNILSECGIPYFEPSEKDLILIQQDIKLLAKLIKDTGVINTYKKGTYFEYMQIRVDIYTPTRKIKKFPISVYAKDETASYSFFYNTIGKLGKAEILYTPNLKTGYDIKCKEIAGSLAVRRICSYPIGGGKITELYCI